MFDHFNKWSIWGCPVRICQAICHQHQLEAGVIKHVAKQNKATSIILRLTQEAHTPQLIPQPDKQKLLICPAKPRISETLPHPAHGLDIGTNQPNTVVNNNSESMWSQKVMGNAFYDLPAQSPRVPVFSPLGHSEHFFGSCQRSQGLCWG